MHCNITKVEIVPTTTTMTMKAMMTITMMITTMTQEKMRANQQEHNDELISNGE